VRPVKDEIETAGYALLPGFIVLDQLGALRNEVDRLLRESATRGGVRNVLGKSKLLRELADGGAPWRAAEAILGPAVRPTKLTVFEKAARSNWKVPFHQDLTISVSHRCDLPGYGPWSVKDGIQHVQPPLAVLQRVIAVRLHLDETPAGNGALRVLPGTHKLGRISRDRIASLRRQIPEAACPLPAGGAMLMSPLLLHASSPAATPSHRRVLHFEYSDAALPDDLHWA